VEDVHQVAELVERDAWLDLFDAAPEHVRQSLGHQSVTIAGIGLLGFRAIPITELNRAMAVGVQDVPSRDDFDAVLTWLDTHASSWALQIAPNANARGVPDYLEKASLARTGPAGPNSSRRKACLRWSRSGWKRRLKPSVTRQRTYLGKRWRTDLVCPPIAPLGLRRW
jgi:hypothetical protein